MEMETEITSSIECSSKSGYTKKQLQGMIDSKDNKIDLIPVDRPSEFWKSFNFIRIDLKKVKDFILCTGCNLVFCFKTTSSSSHSTHYSTCSKKQLSKEVITSTKKLFIRKLDSKAQKKLDRLTAIASALDLRPVSFARKDGFLNLGQFLIDEAVKGKFTLKDYSPHPSTVTKNIKEITLEVKCKMIDSYKNITSAAIILDHWSSRMNMVKFIGICIRYFDWEEKIFKSNVLACSDVIDCKAETTKEELKLTLNEYEITNSINYLVTDNCRTMLCAFDKTNRESNYIYEKQMSLESGSESEDDAEDDSDAELEDTVSNYKWSGCTAHQICTVIKNAFKEMKTSKQLVNVIQLNKNVKRIVTYFNHTGKNKLLKKTLKQEFEVRFDSKFNSFDSVRKSLDELTELAKNDEEILTHLNPIIKQLDLFNQMTDLLEEFYKARIDLSDDTKSNINLVLPYYYSLKSACLPDKDGDVRMNEVKKFFLNSLNKSFRLRDIHYKSCYLTPRFRGMKFIPELERSQVLKNCIKKIREELTSPTFYVDRQKSNISDSYSDILNKTASNLNNNLKFFEDDSEESDSDSSEDDLAYYQKIKLTKDIKALDPTVYYCNLKETIPSLSNYAVSLLNTPATSTIIEQKFSIAGLILSKQRNRLLPDNLQNNLFLKVNRNFI